MERLLQNCGWQLPRSESVERYRDFYEIVFWNVVDPLRIALSLNRNVRWGSSRYLRLHTAMEDAHITSPSTHPHYPKRHGRQRTKCRFSTRNQHPPYKSRGCGMPGAGFLAAICSGYNYSVWRRRVHRFTGLRPFFPGQEQQRALQHAVVCLLPRAF